MSKRVTVGELSERNDQQHQATMLELKGINSHLKTMNGKVFDHEGRVSAIEAKFSLFVKIAVGVAGVGATGAGVGASLLKLLE